MWLRSRRGVVLLVIVVAAAGWLAAIASGLDGARRQLLLDLRVVAAEGERTRTVVQPSLPRPRAEAVPKSAAPSRVAAPARELAGVTSMDTVDSPHAASAQEPGITTPFDDADPDVREAIAAFVDGLDMR